MRNMKRIGLALFMVLVLAMSFGCAKKQVAATPEQASTVEQAPVETVDSGAMTAEQELAEALNKARMVITDELVYFEFDKFDIKADYRDSLKNKAAVMKKFPQLRVLVEGHCDDRGTEEYNLALGERRARAVKEYLMVLGVSASQIEVVSFGEERPAVEGKGEAVWSKNRRAAFKIIK
ncbi:MAG: peptidoglycan-associated lipoprotein Pal [Halodesulfovibrio sp.]